MNPAMASAIGGALMICAAVVAMATLSDCPRRWRVWPALLLALGSLYASDRTLEVFFDSGYLNSVRAMVIISAMSAALGTICVMSWMIRRACPMCIAQKRRNLIPSITSTHQAQPMRKSALR